MNVHQLLMENDFETIWLKGSKAPDEKEDFKAVYEALISKTPKPNIHNMEVHLGIIKGELDMQYDITGKNGDGTPYAIGMTDWDEIAGYTVVLGDFPVETYIIELLDEISFYGMEEDMREQRDDLNTKIEEGKGMTLQELLAEIDNGETDINKFTTWSELKKELDDDDEEDKKEPPLLN